jgi:hypothetical protein
VSTVDLPALLAVTVEVRALDVGPSVERVWRVARAIGVAGVSFVRALPFEAGRPVRVELTLPGDDRSIAASGTVDLVRADDADRPPVPSAVAFSLLDPEPRERIQRYVQTRTTA